MTRFVATGLIWLEGELRPGLATEIAADAVVRPLAASEIPDLHARLVGPPQSGTGQALVAARPLPFASLATDAAQACRRRIGRTP